MGTVEPETKRRLDRQKVLLDELASYYPLFLSGLSLTPLAEVETDVEGKYSLGGHLPSGVVLVAAAKRLVFNTTEYYLWEIFSPSQNLNLNNSNMVQTLAWDKADALHKAAAQVEGKKPENKITINHHQ